MKPIIPDAGMELDNTTSELIRSTAKIQFSEIQRFFAQGILYVVDAQVDLVKVATSMVKDDQSMIASLVDENQFARVEGDLAKQWLAADTTLWCVVVAPYVLVQEVQASTTLQ